MATDFIIALGELLDKTGAAIEKRWCGDCAATV